MISPKTQIHDTKSSGRNMKIKIKQKRKVKTGKQLKRYIDKKKISKEKSSA